MQPASINTTALPQRLEVIIVDDDPDSFELCQCHLLENVDAEYIVQWAKSYEEALDYSRHNKFDIAFVGIHLGQKSGLDLINQFSENGLNMPCILVTVDACYDIDHSTLFCGAADTIQKETITPQILDRSIRHALERQEAANILADERHCMHQVLAVMADAVIMIDSFHCIDHMNLAAESILKSCIDDVRGKNLFHCVDFQVDGSGASVNDQIATALTRQKNYNALNQQNNYLTLKNTADEFYNIECCITPIMSQFSDDTGFICVIKDITEEREWAKKIVFQDSHDKLTGLLNRAAFEQQLQNSVDFFTSTEMESLFCYIDIDHFKVINDSCGHAAGDELLKQVSLLFQEMVCSDDAIARLGSDEFGILLWNCTLENGRPVVDKIMEGLKAFRFNWGDKSYVIDASCSLVIINDECDSWASILSVAHATCLEAKAQGGHRTIVSSDVSHEIAERKGEMEWITEIIQAIEENRLLLYHQLIVPISLEEKGAHFEILVRLQGKDGKVYPPGAFLPAAERYHIMAMVDRWIIQHTLEWLADHPDVLDGLAMCSINLSAETIEEDHLVDFLKNCFEKTGVPPHKICFEVTETVAVTDLRKWANFIDQFREMGCLFALDDFGTGMSSFAYLQNLNVDYVKIDGSFVSDMHTNPVNYALVKSINEVGHTMGKKMIAEFVENDEILDELKTLGVDFAQGYHFGKPEPLE